MRRFIVCNNRMCVRVTDLGGGEAGGHGAGDGCGDQRLPQDGGHVVGHQLLLGHRAVVLQGKDHRVL